MADHSVGALARYQVLAGTPPLFVAKLLVRQTANCQDKKLTPIGLGMSCALLYAPGKRNTYIEFPKEDGQDRG